MRGLPVGRERRRESHQPRQVQVDAPHVPRGWQYREGARREQAKSRSRCRSPEHKKILHQFALDGHWCAAWKCTGLANPYQKPRCGASTLELEVALGGQKRCWRTALEVDLRRSSKAALEQKVEDDLRRRSKAVLAGTMEGADDGDDTQPKGKKKSRTKDKET